MSVKLPPQGPSALNHTNHAHAPAQAEQPLRVQLKNELLASMGTNSFEQANEGLRERQRKMGFVNDLVPLHQPTGTSCGPTAVAMLAQAAGRLPAGTTAQNFVQQVDPQGLSRDRTTGAELDKMLKGTGLRTAWAGTSIQNAFKQFVSGKPLVALADVNTIRPNVSLNAPAQGSHYVVITGMDKLGRMKVTDPQLGKSYSIIPGRLDLAVQRAQNREGGGGYFAVSGDGAMDAVGSELAARLGTRHGGGGRNGAAGASSPTI